eukprot:2144644-Pyramimonas_sp.AAC.1
MGRVLTGHARRDEVPYRARDRGLSPAPPRLASGPVRPKLGPCQAGPVQMATMWIRMATMCM